MCLSFNDARKLIQSHELLKVKDLTLFIGKTVNRDLRRLSINELISVPTLR